MNLVFNRYNHCQFNMPVPIVTFISTDEYVDDDDDEEEEE